MAVVKNLLTFLMLVLLSFSCKKESFTTRADLQVRTSVDSLHFDTVFTTTGSISNYLKIVNGNDKGIRISSVRLAGGVSSPFKINVDGIAGPQVNDVEVMAEDSIYIYVTVTINPTAQNLPFVVRDSIEINYNGNKKWVQLDAFGQNAHFYRNRKITGSEVWNNDLPYVILGGITVDTPATLTINKGCHVYMHADAPFIVNGSLQVNGEKFDSTRVIFTGDRLDEPYRDFPASYPGLIFTASSRNNILNYAIIKNAYQAVVAVNPATVGTKLTLNETIIDNAYDAGLLGFNTSIAARNLLVSNCGKNLFLVGGGTYDFKHATIATFSNSYIQHKEPVAVFTNYVDQTAADLTANFTNCIFWGEKNGFVPNEVVAVKNPTAGFSVSFTNVLWRMEDLSKLSGASVTAAINQQPVFDSINTAERFFNFRLKPNSPAKDAGSLTAGVMVDLDGNTRPRPVGTKPDLGAYERD